MLLLAISVFLVGALPSSGTRRTGAIRGGVYVDQDGDGTCDPQTDVGVPGVFLAFSSDVATIRLYSGDDGTYGLVAAGTGRWEVLVEPTAVGRVTSTNPRVLEIGTYGRYVHTGVDFCLQSGTAVTVTAPVVAGPADISEQLLTTPPEPAPPPDLADRAAEPPEQEVAVAEWLAYLNQFRAMGDLPALAEDPALTAGAQQHSRFMVLADRPIAHSQSAGSPLYTPEGQQAAVNSNIFATTQVVADHQWSINFWVSAPFHLVPMLDPALEVVGYGQYREAVGTFQMAAVLDVRSALGDGRADADYPVFFPGEETWVLRQSLYEWPDPLSSCPGYARPVGPPLVLQLGDGELTPRVSSITLYENGRAVPACAFSETSYTNSDAYEQQTGRVILDERDAVVVMPRRPLVGGASYHVVLVVNGEPYEWSFTAATRAP